MSRTWIASACSRRSWLAAMFYARLDSILVHLYACQKRSESRVRLYLARLLAEHFQESVFG